MTVIRWLSFSQAFFLLLICLTSCQSPGQGQKAEQGFAISDPLIAALDEYHTEQGAYPDSLMALASEYIDEIPTEFDGIAINYEKIGQSYRLSFGYEGPGINQCFYTPETLWDCQGHY